MGLTVSWWRALAGIDRSVTDAAGESTCNTLAGYCSFVCHDTIKLALSCNRASNVSSFLSREATEASVGRVL